LGSARAFFSNSPWPAMERAEGCRPSVTQGFQGLQQLSGNGPGSYFGFFSVGIQLPHFSPPTGWDGKEAGRDRGAWRSQAVLGRQGGGERSRRLEKSGGAGTARRRGEIEAPGEVRRCWDGRTGKEIEGPEASVAAGVSPGGDAPFRRLVGVPQRPRRMIPSWISI
jgi:hypothetical protein